MPHHKAFILTRCCRADGFGGIWFSLPGSTGQVSLVVRWPERSQFRFSLTDDIRLSDNGEMPCISEFYGIAVYMYYRDHAPPHFHAIYGEFEAEIVIASAEIGSGELPRRARSLVTDWAEIHRDELQENWDLARQARPLNPIDPLV